MPRQNRRTLLSYLGLRRRHLSLPGVRHFLSPLTRRAIIPWSFVSGARLDATFTVACHDVRFKYRATPDDLFGQVLYWRSWRFQGPLPVLMLQWARTARRVIDVGAHTGFHTLLVASANPRCEVYSFEPLPQAFTGLDRNVRLNGFERCKLFQAAVGASDGWAELRLPSEDPTTASIVPNKGASVSVRLLALDSAIPDDMRTDVVKIDVEGYEPEVMKGMHRILECCRPRVVFECNPGGPAGAVEMILRHHHYQIFAIDQNADLQLVNEPFNPDVYPDHNFAALPEPAGEWHLRCT